MIVEASIGTLIIGMGLALPFMFSGCNNPYASIVSDIRHHLKIRYRAKQQRGRFRNITFKEYEDRVYKCMPFINPEDVVYRTKFNDRYPHMHRRNI